LMDVGVFGVGAAFVDMCRLSVARNWIVLLRIN
jgi:hypothetical protein